MSQYINEAFKQFRLLESEDLDLSPTGLDTLDTFMNQAMSDEDVDIIDLEAEAEEDLKKSYIGKVICDCNVCHSNIFYNKEDIVIDEDGIVNIEDECPYCMSLDGYTIVGEIKPYEEGVAEEEHEDDVDLDVDLDDDEEAEEPIEIESEDDDDLDESLQLSESDKKSIEDYESTILKIFNTNDQEVVDSYIKDNILVVECDNSNPTLITDLRRSLKRKLPDNIEFDSEGNDNGFYGKTYEFYIYDDLDESLTEGFSKGQDVYIKPNKRFGKIKSHIKNDLYEVETYDGKDKGLPDRIDTYYASDLKLKESLPLSGVAKLKGKKTLRRRDEHDGCKCILGRNNTKLSGDKDLHESIELGDDGQTIWSGVPVREDSIANNPHTTNRMIWSDDDEEGYIEYLVSLGIPDEQLCHEFYKRGWNSEDALEEYKNSDLSLHESIENDLIKGKTYTCVDEEDGKYKYIGKVEHPEFGELFKFKPLDNAAKEITQEMSDEMGLTYDGFAYMDEETVFYTFLDSEDDLHESLHESIDDIYNDVMTPEEARKYWDSEKDNDPVLVEFDNFQDWYDESVKNGYIKESITEETDITTVKVDALSNGPEDEEEFKSWLANHYPNLFCEFTDDIYDNLILTGPKQDIKKYLLNDYSYEVEGEDWVVTQYPQLKESITESTEKFEIVPAGSGKWEVLKNSVDGGRVSEDSRLVIDADTKEEAKEILLANGFKAEELLESIENVSIDTEDETMTMTTKEDGGVVIETSPKEEFEETFEEEEPTELENGDEMIAPLDPETEDELGITDESEEDDMNFDFGEETSEEPEEDVDIDEFDEETFDGLGESYLRRCYENVNSFKTTNVICNENLLTVEGNIGFKSGNVKKTSFIFEAKESNNGKYVFEGYNNEINIGKKAFRLNCSIDNKKIIPESLNYNYRSKNDLNESVKLHGTVKAPKRG